MTRQHTSKLIIHGLDKMTKGQRSFVARWLERQARFIRPMHREFSSRYTSRIMK